MILILDTVRTLFDDGRVILGIDRVRLRRYHPSNVG
jgi:hypothetical protein